MQAPEPAGSPSPEDYRHVISRFATGVSVVSTVSDGVRYGMTVNSLTSVSLRPLLVLFCCEEDASLHEPVLESGQWAVSILAVGQQDVAAWFATRGARGVDQFAGQRAVPGPLTGAPLLDEALAWLECRTWATYDGGDHTIVVGEVVAVEQGADGDPLLYYRSDYRTTR